MCQIFRFRSSLDLDVPCLDVASTLGQFMFYKAPGTPGTERPARPESGVIFLNRSLLAAQKPPSQPLGQFARIHLVLRAL